MLRKRTNAYWQKRSTERVALLERQSEPYIRKINAELSQISQSINLITGNQIIIGNLKIPLKININGWKDVTHIKQARSGVWTDII